MRFKTNLSKEKIVTSSQFIIRPDFFAVTIQLTINNGKGDLNVRIYLKYDSFS